MRALLRVLSICVTSVLVTSSARADWIKPLVTPRAHVDSIERVLVIRDRDSLQSFGKRMLDLGDIEGGVGHELLVTRWQGGHDTNLCFIYDGGPHADAVPDRSYPYIGPWLDKIGDINRDGYVDLGQWHLPVGYPKDFDIFYGGPGFNGAPDIVVRNHASFAHDAIDLDGDGFLELPVTRDVNAFKVIIDIYKTGPVFDTVPGYVIPDTSRSFGSQICSGDFNGDGYGDIAVTSQVNVGHGHGRVHIFFGGEHFNPKAGLIIEGTTYQFGEMLLNVGDFNRDGYDDLLICGDGGFNKPDGLYMGSAHFDGTLDVVVNQYRGGFGYFSAASVARAGDVNHDGFPDFIIGHYVIARYDFQLYLGGRDITPYMPGDLWVEESMIPGAQLEMGESVAGIGDFTGDGIDDFAVRSTTSTGSDPAWYGEVNIFAGWQSKDTTTPPIDTTLPWGFSFSQNYPNPFNNTTTIEFELNRPGAVKLAIFNTLGEEVRELWNKPMRPGVKRFTWDGANDAGRQVASGVYLSRLQFEGHSWSRKMQLIR